MLGIVLPIGPTWGMFFLSFVIGSLYGLAYVMWQRTWSLKVAVPFGPALIVAFYLVWIGQSFTQVFTPVMRSWVSFVELVWNVIN